MDRVHGYIGVRGTDNFREMSDVGDEGLKRYQALWWKKVHIESRIPKTRWVVLRWPTASMAQQAGMSTAGFEDFYFEVVNVDYAAMSAAMDPLVDRLARTDRVRITAPGTDLTFSVKGIPVLKADGRVNVPDGEVYTAPVRESVNGTIAYNAPSLYHGTEFRDVRFTFRDGKIVEEDGSEPEQLRRILDSDEGARYVGEFAIGLNPKVHRPMLDTLFDEKIAGSIHITPGNAYDDAFNGNRSEVHWDLVLIQTPAWGGGEIWFDDILIRRDGHFVLPELAPLNP
jgi:aminopeptidase